MWLPACLEPRALLVRVLVGGGYLHALNLVSLVRALVVGWWLEVVTCMPWSLCLGACALELVPWWFVLGGGYLHTLVVRALVVVTCMPWSLFLGLCVPDWCAWKWLPAYLGACVLGSCLAGSCPGWK